MFCTKVTEPLRYIIKLLPSCIEIIAFDMVRGWSRTTLDKLSTLVSRDILTPLPSPHHWPLSIVNQRWLHFDKFLKKVSFDQFSFYNIFRPMKRDKIKLIHFRKKKNRKILSRRETNIVWKISKEFFCWYTGSPLWTTGTLFLVVRVGMCTHYVCI